MSYRMVAVKRPELIPVRICTTLQAKEYDKKIKCFGALHPSILVLLVWLA